MNPLERALLLEQVSTLGPQAVVQALLAAFVLGVIVALVHRWSVPHRLVPPSLVASLALLPVVAALVLMVIGDSLARSFALVGALAIVRFRTRLRSTWDITFVFLALSVGIACGVGKPLVGLLGTVVAVLAVFVLGVLPGARPHQDIHQLRCDVSAWQVGEADLQPVIDKHARKRWLTSVRTVRFGESMSLDYRLVLNKGASLEGLARDLSQVEGVERVTVLSEDDATDESR